MLLLAWCSFTDPIIFLIFVVFGGVRIVSTCLLSTSSFSEMLNYKLFSKCQLDFLFIFQFQFKSSYAVQGYLSLDYKGCSQNMEVQYYTTLVSWEMG